MMQELVGRLTALDPESGDEVKVIGYFDALVAGSAGTEALLRGAALLSGVAAGAVWPGGGLRVSSDGLRLPLEGDGSGWPRCDAADAHVWIERDGRPHANDAMVLERCALAVSILRARHQERSLGPLAVLVDADRDPAERAAAAARARLGQRVRAVAVDEGSRPSGLSTVLRTAHGAVRVGVLCPDDPVPDTATLGLGTWGSPEDLPRSWATARRALRISRCTGEPVDADALGGLLDAATALARIAPTHPDVVALEGLDRRALEVLDGIVDAESLRHAAVALRMHHSTLTARRARLADTLGYDPWSPVGRTRYRVARLAQQLR